MSVDQYERDVAGKPGANAPAEAKTITTLDTLKADKQAEKQRAVEMIEDALNALDRDDREPDAWERDCLAMAIDSIFRGLYGLAETEANLAMTPPNQRGRPSPLPDENLDFTKKVLREVLAQANAEPLRLSPSFGPIVLAE